MTTGLVGSIVGPLFSSSSVAAATLGDTGHGYDVAVGGLGFKLKISEGTPYERATAQFRKEQFDNSGTYGDQSLTGMWTRGQFSFHKGAGLRYYEVSDGETVLNRYSDSQGVDPFSELGEATLQPEWTNTTSSGPFGVIVWGGSGNGFFAFLDSTVLKYATSLTGATTSYTPTSGWSVAATNGPLCAYVATSDNKIERVGIAPGAPASGAIYTHTTGIHGVFYAKDRLWAVDAGGVWYQLSPNPTAPPVAIAAGDKVFTAADGWDSNWSLVDTPGPVLIGNGTRIYSVTVGSDGAVPTLGGPIQVAELPPGEYIRALNYHLGFLAISTNRGARIAVVAESGQVTYGPLLVEWTTEALGITQIARRDSSVVFAGNAGLYEVDLSQQIGNGLEFAWCRLPDPYTDFAVGGTGTAYGVFSFNGSTLIAWATRSLPSVLGSLKHEGSNRAATGFLTTAYHRFGTLEPKKFQTVKVRGGGTGSIDIYRVMADGSAISLYTMALTQNDTADITLGLSDPIEVVGLKFVLNRDPGDSTKGPTLLGYQLRALPAPKRQRMIRLPVLLHDVEKRGSTRALGYEGSAWERLSALEEMEQSGGTFQFQDFRTGEAGEVYIESIEHKGITPPGHRDNGYGGVVWLTLKKL